VIVLDIEADQCALAFLERLALALLRQSTAPSFDVGQTRSLGAVIDFAPSASPQRFERPAARTVEARNARSGTPLRVKAERLLHAWPEEHNQ
jgi:hypothetical protein